MAGGFAPVDRQAVLALVVVELVCALLLLFGNRLPAPAITGAAAALLAPANSTLHWIQSVATARSDATRLSGEVAQLRIERDRMLDAGLENARLRNLLGFAERGRPTLKAVQVVGVAGEPWPVIYHLNGGADRGLAIGQAALAPEGLVGRIVRVDSRTSSVALITDPNAPVACEVVGSGVRGVLKFRFGPDPGLYLTAVPLTDTVRVGERVVTSETSILFPPGIPVGRVSRVGREATGLLSAIRVEPFAPLSRVREVLVAVGPIEPAWWPKPAPPADSLRADSARVDTLRAELARVRPAGADSARGSR
jgi:rod shape-determining protein MreC